MRFADRTQAGARLAGRLAQTPWADPVVLGLPGGGVPVGVEVARRLDVPFDVIVVRKLGVPHQPELAMGAIGEDGARVVSARVVAAVGVTAADVAAVEAVERRHLEQRLAGLRAVRPRVPLAGRTAIVVDDGVATGATAGAACLVARARGALRVVLAVPVAAPGALEQLARVADAVVWLERPSGFEAVGAWYDDFSPVTDEEVLRLLARAGRSDPAPGPAPGDAPGVGPGPGPGCDAVRRSGRAVTRPRPPGPAGSRS